MGDDSGHQPRIHKMKIASKNKDEASILIRS